MSEFLPAHAPVGEMKKHTMVAPFLLDLLGQFIRAGSVYTNVYKTSMYVCKRLYAHKSVYMRPSLNLPFDSYRVY